MHWTVELEGGPRRVNHAAVAIGEYVWSFGGYCSGESLDADHPIDIHVLDTRTYRWYAVEAENQRSARSSSSSSESLEVEYLPEIPEDEDEVLVHNVPGREYLSTKRTKAVPYQRYGHTVCAWNGKAYLWGGRNDDHGASSSLHEFDPMTRKWNLVQTNGRVPPARDGHSAVVVDNKMYLFGGFEEDLQRFSQETHVFDFTTKVWREMRTNGVAPLWRDFHTAVAIDNKMYVFGGRSDQSGQFHSTNDVYDERLKMLDLSTGEWTTPNVKGSKPGGRRSHSAWTFQNKMFIFGGFQGTMNKHYNELYSFDTKDNSWEKLDTIGVRPSPRRRQCTVMVGSRLFLFGGTMPNIASNNGNTTTTGLTDLDDLYVLDYTPTLRQLAARRLLDIGVRKSMLRFIPKDIRDDLVNMTEPNKISNGCHARIDMAG